MSVKFPGGEFQQISDRIIGNRQMLRRMGEVGKKAIKPGAAAIKAIGKVAMTKVPKVVGYGAVLAAGVIGAKVIAKAGGQLNKDVKKYGEQTSDQQESILKGLREKNQKKRRENEKYSPQQIKEINKKYKGANFIKYTPEQQDAAKKIGVKLR